jgi:transcriptional regulator with XRE-family HTH domain
MHNFDSLPLGEALRVLRSRHQLRQYQLAAKAKVTKAMLSSFETGKTKPSLGSLLSIVFGMGSDLGELQEVLDILTGKRVPQEEPPEPASADGPSGQLVQVRVQRLEELVAVLERFTAALERLAPSPPAQ